MFVLRYPNLLVTVDHQPLTKIFSENIKIPRLFSFRERALIYKFTIRHLPRNLNAAPNSAARYPVWTPSEGSTEIPQISSAHTQQVHRCSGTKTTTADAVEPIDSTIKAAFTFKYEHGSRLRAISWDRTVASSAAEEKYQTLAKYIRLGFPKSRPSVGYNSVWAHARGIILRRRSTD